MKKDRSVLTTGEAAKLMRVSLQTVIRLFDEGQLKGWKIPGTKTRRIARLTPIQFMAERGIPLPEPETVAA